MKYDLFKKNQKSLSFHGKAKVVLPIEKYFLTAYFTEGVPLLEIENILLSIINYLGDSAHLNSIGEILGFKIDIKDDAKYFHDPAEEAILIDLLRPLISEDLIECPEETPKIYKLSYWGKVALVQRTKYRFFSSKTLRYQGFSSLKTPSSINLYEIFADEQTKLHFNSISPTNVSQLCWANKEEIKQLDALINNYELFSTGLPSDYSEAKKNIEVEFYQNKAGSPLLVAYFNGKYPEELTSVLNFPENKEFKNEVIEEIRFKAIWEDEATIFDSLTIKEFFDKWDWPELANRNLVWEEAEVLQLFAERGDILSWTILSEKIPAQFLQAYLPLFSNYWNWELLTVSPKVSNEFILNTIDLADHHWDVSTVIDREPFDASFIVSLIEKVKASNEKKEEKYIFYWDLYPVTNEIPNDVIKQILPAYVNLDYSELSKRDPLFVLDILKSVLQINSGREPEFQVIPNWDWSFILAEWPIDLIIDNINLLKNNIDWYLFLSRIFSDSKLQAAYLSDFKFHEMVNQATVHRKFANENFLWNENLIDFLDTRDLIRWSSWNNNLGFTANKILYTNLEIFSKYQTRFTSSYDQKIASMKIEDNAYIYANPNFHWDWYELFRNNKIKVDYQLVSTFKESIDWETATELLPEEFIQEHFSEFEKYWDHSVLSKKTPQLIEILFPISSDKSRWNFKELSRRAPASIISLNLEKFSWDFEELSNRDARVISEIILSTKLLTSLWRWDKLVYHLDLDNLISLLSLINTEARSTEIPFLKEFFRKASRKLTPDYLIENYRSFKFNWDWHFLTNHFDVSIFLNNMGKFAEYLDWQVLMHKKMTLKETINERTFSYLCKTGIRRIKSIEARKRAKEALTQKLQEDPIFLENKMWASLEDKSIQLDWDVISSFSRITFTAEKIDAFKNVLNWDLLSQNTKINWDHNYLRRFRRHWNWSYISENSTFLKPTVQMGSGRNKSFNIKALKQFKSVIDWAALSRRNDILFNDKILKEFSKCSWSYKSLSAAEGLKISNSFLVDNAHLNWDCHALSRNIHLNFKYFTIKNNFVDEDFHNAEQEETSLLILLKNKDWDWNFLASKADVELRYELLDETKQKPWNWKAITQRLDIKDIEPFLELLSGKDLDWEHIQRHPEFKPTPELIDKYFERWDWTLLSANSTIELDMSFILKYKEYWNYSYLTSNISVLSDIRIFYELPDKEWNFNILSDQLPLIQDEKFLHVFKNKLNWDSISNNDKFNFTEGIFKQFKHQWNYIALEQNHAIQRDPVLKKAVADVLKNDPMLNFIVNIEKRNSPWGPYVYHFSHLSNAAKIINDLAIKSRETANQINNSAGTVIESNRKGRKFARFYLRPHSPAQFYNQNLGKIPSDDIEVKEWFFNGTLHRKVKYPNFYSKAAGMGFPKCPNPVFFRINIKELLGKHFNKAHYSDGNLQTSWAKIYPFDGSKSVNINYNELFSTPESIYQDAKSRAKKTGQWDESYRSSRFEAFKISSQQEILIPDELSLVGLNSLEIICQTLQDYHTLLRLIDKENPLRKAITYDHFPYHGNNTSFNIDHTEDQLTVHTNFKDEGYLTLIFENGLGVEEIKKGDILDSKENLLKVSKNVQLTLKKDSKFKMLFMDLNPAGGHQEWLIYSN